MSSPKPVTNWRQPTPAERTLIEDAILGARVMRPYYGVALSALTPLCVDGIGTIGVDKFWRLYVDPVWFETKTPEERAALICEHEVEHLLRNHNERCGHRHPALFNLCGDAEINDDQTSGKLPDGGGLMPKNIGQKDGLTAEEYYDNLKFKDCSDDDEMQECSGPGQAGSALNPDGSINVKYAKRKGGDCGSGAGGDKRPYEADEGDAPGVSQPEAKANQQATAAAVRDHMSKHGRGSVPAGVAVWADEIAKPVIPKWERVVAAWIGKATAVVSGRADYSWRLPSRRQQDGLPIRPRCIGRPPRIKVVCDTSGSMGGLGGWALGILKAIERKWSSVVVFDTDAAAKRHRRGQKHMGGGGTDMGAGIKAADKDCDGIIVVTDGDTPWPKEPPKARICVLVPEGGPKTPKWAERIEVKTCVTK